MNHIDKLRADVVRQRERIEQLEKDAKDCQKALEAAHSAWMGAKMRLLKRMIQDGKLVDGVWRWNPWTAPTEKELGELREAVESCWAAKVSRQETLQAANASVEQAKDLLNEMRQAWLPVLGPFPRDT